MNRKNPFDFHVTPQPLCVNRAPVVRDIPTLAIGLVPYQLATQEAELPRTLQIVLRNAAAGLPGFP